MIFLYNTSKRKYNSSIKFKLAPLTIELYSAYPHI